MRPTQAECHRRSLAAPGEFWADAAGAIDWDRRWDRVLDADREPFFRWFSGAMLNTCHNALDRHVAGGRADQAALIYDSPVTGTIATYTYRQLRDRVALCAGALLDHGVGRGDRVILYMPMIPEAVIAMLACARIGAIHSVVFGGFAADELAKRIDDCTPALIISASCGIEPGRLVPYKPLLDEAIRLAKSRPGRCIIVQRPQVAATMVPGRDVGWDEAMAAAKPAGCVPVAATDPLYILYTSGSTGIPKGVVRDNGGHAVALAWSMRHVYGVEPGEVFWAASDVGWVVGHSYIVYGPLLHGCTTVLYEGKPVCTPDPGAFWRVIAQHRVSVLFTAPTAIRAIRREDPAGTGMRAHDLGCLKALFLAGERCDPDTMGWAGERLGVPVVDHWWQTETGWAITAGCRGLESSASPAGSAGKPVPGYDVRVLGPDGQEVAAGTVGTIVIRLPLPPGTLPTMWRNDDAYRKHYLDRFPGHYLSGDAGYQDAAGDVWIMSRIDDIINVAGHRLSTGAMEEVLSAHPAVAECAVIGVADPLKGEVPVGLLVLKAGVGRPHAEIVREVIQSVRDRIGPVAAFKQAVVVTRLPKTRSGKILRSTMRRIADGGPCPIPPTIDDPAIPAEIAVALATIGLPRTHASNA